MDTRPTVEELWSLLQEQRAMMEEQRAEIASLKEELAARERSETLPPARQETTPVAIHRRLSRAGLLKAAAAGVAGAASAAVLRPESASAFTKDDYFLAEGSGNFAFYNDGSPQTGVSVVGTHTGVLGNSRAAGLGGDQPHCATGVFGVCSSPNGIGYGVQRWSKHSHGQLGVRFGVYGGVAAVLAWAGPQTTAPVSRESV